MLPSMGMKIMFQWTPFGWISWIQHELLGFDDIFDPDLEWFRLTFSPIKS